MVFGSKRTEQSKPLPFAFGVFLSIFKKKALRLAFEAYVDTSVMLF